MSPAPDPGAGHDDGDHHQLRMSEARLRALFEQSSDMIAVYDGQGRMVQMGDGIRQLGFDPEKVRGTDPMPLVHPDDVDRVRAAVAEVMGEAGARAVVEYRFSDARGQWHWLETIFSNHLHDPAVAGMIANTRDVSDRRAASDALRHETLHDPLTGLPNRVLLLDRLQHALERTARTGGLLAVLYADLDGFKAVNDSKGHAVGDDVLRSVATNFAEAVRAGDTAARIGGDEFVVVCEDLTGVDEAEEIAARVVRAASRPVEVGVHRLQVGVSVGIATAKAGDEVLAILDRADRAMYRAKAAGGTRSRL